jgi:hypothetical protein
MGTKNKSGRRSTRPVWERGYYSHGYWRGKVQLGTVKLGPRSEWDGKYRWQAGSHAGESTSLADAKRSVEQAALVGASQLALFVD